MTSIVWNNGKLVADTRVTLPGLENYKDNQVLKIMEGGSFYFGNEKVLAIGVSGCAMILNYIHIVQDIFKGNIDLSDSKYWTGVWNNAQPSDVKQFQMLLVLDDKIITLENVINTDQVNWLAYPSSNMMGIGTGPAALTKTKFDTINLFAACALVNMPAASVVALAKKFDHRTGGDLVTWDRENGLRSQVKCTKPLAAGIELFKLATINDLRNIKNLMKRFFTTKPFGRVA